MGNKKKRGKPTKCQGCGEIFPARNRKQRYCDKADCQGSRKREWEKIKLCLDKEYKANRRDSQKRWRKKHQGYWKEYRSAHPEYVKWNLEKQRLRNKKRGENGTVLQTGAVIAKTDASVEIGVESGLKSGTYKLLPYRSKVIANTDVTIVQLRIISTG